MSLVDDIIIRGDELRTQLSALLPRHKYLGNTKNQALIGYVDISLEHHKAIWLLIKSELNGSAFAVARSVFDAYFRALWVNKVATPEQIEQVWRDEWKLPMWKMYAQIKQDYLGTSASNDDAKIAEQAHLGFQALEKMWTILSSYTHSGGLQLGRRFTGDKVEPNYSEAEIAEVLNWATTVLMMLLRMFFVSMGHFEETKEIKTKAKRWWQQYHADCERLNQK
jgi:uncharacterized protein DUF6988